MYRAHGAPAARRLVRPMALTYREIALIRRYAPPPPNAVDDRKTVILSCEDSEGSRTRSSIFAAEILRCLRSSG